LLALDVLIPVALAIATVLTLWSPGSTSRRYHSRSNLSGSDFDRLALLTTSA